jgi:hypothetical protein
MDLFAHLSVGRILCDDAPDVVGSRVDERRRLRVYGAAAGNLCLKTLPFGGLYIAGGIAAKNMHILHKNEQFIREFLWKGRMKVVLDRIPIYLIKHPQVGLLGSKVICRRIVHATGQPQGRSAHTRAGGAPERESAHGVWIPRSFICSHRVYRLSCVLCVVQRRSLRSSKSVDPIGAVERRRRARMRTRIRSIAAVAPSTAVPSLIAYTY